MLISPWMVSVMVKMLVSALLAFVVDKPWASHLLACDVVKMLVSHWLECVPIKMLVLHLLGCVVVQMFVSRCSGQNSGFTFSGTCCACSQTLVFRLANFFSFCIAKKCCVRRRIEQVKKRYVVFTRPCKC
jgi:hypothetical protein